MIIQQIISLASYHTPDQVGHALVKLGYKWHQHMTNNGRTVYESPNLRLMVDHHKHHLEAYHKYGKDDAPPAILPLHKLQPGALEYQLKTWIGSKSHDN